MNEINNNILINAVPICKKLLKIGVREPNIANIDETSLSNTNIEQIIVRWCCIKCFSGIDISYVFSDNGFSLISSESAVFLLNF